MVQAASYPPLQRTQGRGTHYPGTGSENTESRATRHPLLEWCTQTSSEVGHPPSFTIVRQERAAVSPNSVARKTNTLLVLLALVLVVALSVGVMSYGVHVDIMRTTADVGIPGVTTSYGVKLRNHTVLPITFEGVQMPGGYPASGVWFHYRVERWDTKAKTWSTVAEINPTTMGNNPVVTKRVWPGGTLYPVTWEATAARDAFQKGDQARFVIFSSLKAADASGQKVIYSPAFQIEEEPSRRHSDGGWPRLVGANRGQMGRSPISRKSMYLALPTPNRQPRAPLFIAFPSPRDFRADISAPG